MKKGRHRRFEEARALKRTVEVIVEPCPECGAPPDEEHASWCLATEDLDVEDDGDGEADGPVPSGPGPGPGPGGRVAGGPGPIAGGPSGPGPSGIAAGGGGQEP